MAVAATRLDGMKAQYQLYYNPFSICSLMVLYTLALRGKPKTPELAVDPEEHFVDIYTGEQMTEEYLEKNWKGQVPALLAPSANIKLVDSMDITNHLCERYPSLVPAEHEQTIRALLDELHEISYVSLSFKPEDRRVEGIEEAVNEILNRPDISDKYRQALHRKMENHFSQYGNSHTQETISNHEGRARAYLAKVGALLAEHNDNSTRDPLSNTSQTWIFGHEVGATALDAHTAVFIARLLDAQRENLIPAEVLKYGKPLLASKEWQGITQGRPTLHTVWEAQQSAPLGPGHA